MNKAEVHIVKHDKKKVLYIKYSVREICSEFALNKEK